MSLVRFIFIASLLCFAACREKVAHDLNEYDTNLLLTQLHQSGFDVQRERQPNGLWNISVAKSETVAALNVLGEKRLLRKPVRSERKETGIMSSREERHFAYERALSKEIERTILTLDGVLDVRVHLNLPKRDPILGKKIDAAQQASASVLLITSSLDAAVTSEKLAGIVAGASGIPRAQVEVLISASDEAAPKEVAAAVALPVAVPPVVQQSSANWFGSYDPLALIAVATVLLLTGALLIFGKKLPVFRSKKPAVTSKSLELKLSAGV